MIRSVIVCFLFTHFSVTSPFPLYLWTDWAWGGALPPPELPQFQLGGQMPHKTIQWWADASQNITMQVHYISEENSIAVHYHTVQCVWAPGFKLKQ